MKGAPLRERADREVSLSETSVPDRNKDIVPDRDNYNSVPERDSIYGIHNIV
jgi:hypothetical protein